MAPKKSLVSLLCLSFFVWAGVAARAQTAAAEARALEPGKPVERELSAGETHAYQVSLSAGQLLRAVVNQRGVDVVVVVRGPDGQKLSEVDSPNGNDGPEPVTVAANVSGAYRLEVRPLDAAAKPGRYEVKIEEVLSAAEHNARLAEERAVADAARGWLAANAMRLSTVEAGHGFADLQPLKKTVGQARIVSLGEATHGTREFFQLKHRMLEFLVSEMGFNIFAIEATMPESFDINEYVLTGKGDPAKGLAGIYFWTWDTEEVLELIQWMRRYNADPRHTRKVKFYGFDMQSGARAAKVTLAYLRRVGSPLAEAAERELGIIADPYTEPEFQRLPKEKKAAAAETVKAILSDFDGRKQEYVRRTGADEWAVARQHARVLSQNIELQSQDFFAPGSFNVRDRSMAENVGWILEHEGPGAKAVLWAHNGHVAAHEEGGIAWMGSHLRRTFGAEMVVFGFAFNRGGFQAVEMPFPSERGLRAFNVEAAPPESLDAVLAAAGLQQAAIDLRALPKDGPVAKWFAEPRATRSIGAGYGDAFAANFFAKENAPKVYDALLFVERTTAARPVGKDDGPLPQQKLAAPANADFESGAVGQPPADWQVRPKLRRYDFQIVTSEERPHAGRRSAMIARPPGRHYGEIAGSFGQRLDASAYRGKKIRLRAAARAEQTGAGNRSWLRLSVTRKAFGPQATAFDSASQYPVTSAEWRVYEIVADVPADADAISYGLALTGDGRAWLDSVSLEVLEQ
jgi:erythromycin esterase